MTVTVLTAERAARLARSMNDPAADLLDEINSRRQSKSGEMNRFADLCDRYDNLYYPNAMHKDGGADHWPAHESATTVGRVHVSLNVYPAYVDIPASLQSVEPIENIRPKAESGALRDLAAEVERVYFAWKERDGFEVKGHKACVVKGLYGRTAAKVYWDPNEAYPCVQIVDQPRNLWLGWSNQNYERLDWAVYSYAISPNEAMENFGVDIGATEIDEGRGRVRVPFVRAAGGDHTDPLGQLNGSTTRDWLDDTAYMVECLDYWYRKPKDGARIELGKPTPMETWNAIFVGNVLVKDKPHPEYDGKLPYVPLFNTYIPGLPDGRSEFYDIEQIIREKEERLSMGGQMIAKGISGQYWQLTGQEAPDTVPAGVKPRENQVVAPGPGNRIEKIEPFMPEFQLEAYLTRLDRELIDVSGLNDLLRGLAPASVMSSSKAINALVANYEARIRMKRDMYYRWRAGVWSLVQTVWGNKVPDMKLAFSTVAPIDITAPSITPRDDLETATLASNMLNSKIWGLSRAMDVTGVDDPEAEKDMIREERTDATLFPADVQVMAALMATIQQLKMTQQQMGGQDQMGQLGAQQGAAGQASMVAQNGGQMGMPMMNGEGEQSQPPPEALPLNAGGEPIEGGLGPSGPGENFFAQTAIEGGEAQNRILMQQPIAPEQA